MNIAIVGSGYVGLVTGACLAEIGAQVVCVDVDRRKIELLQKGASPIYEPGLDELLEKGIRSGRLGFSTSLAGAVAASEIIFIAVGTPPAEDGSADVSHVLGVAREIGRAMDSYKLVVTKSTVPVGTAIEVRREIEQELAARGADIDFDVASNPEFLKEGSAIADFMRPDRVVVGVDSVKARGLLESLYRPMQLSGFRMIFMDVLSAEMTKYAANAMLATRISFMNEVANLCEKVGADVNMVRKGIGSDTRIGNKFLYPGAGYGGSCFPKDVKALIRTGSENGSPMSVLEAVEEVNARQKRLLFDKLSAHYGGDLRGRRIALWGLSFKPETDDVREATSLVLARLILEAGAQLWAYDPIAVESFSRAMGCALERDGKRDGAGAGKSVGESVGESAGKCTEARVEERIHYVEDKYDALEGADALIIVTEWKEFRLLALDRIKNMMKNPVILDGRNIYDRKEMEAAGIEFFNIGG